MSVIPQLSFICLVACELFHGSHVGIARVLEGWFKVGYGEQCQRDSLVSLTKCCLVA